MTTTIALAGKGGVGKTTIAGLVVRYLAEKNLGPILAIDADPSSNLNMVLGLDLSWTVGDIREGMLEQVKESLTVGGAAMGTISGGQTKNDYLDYQIRSSISEGDYFDLIAMGRSEGQGCYCAVNHNLRNVIDAIGKNYRYVVIDNEAGMEHLSRRTTRDVDHLLIISDASQRGIVAAQRIAGFRNELNIHIKNSYLIINRLDNDLSEEMKEVIDKIGIEYLGGIRSDPQITEFDLNGKPIINISKQSSTYQLIALFLDRILL